LPVSKGDSFRIAVASRDGLNVAGHIGKCPDWIVFEARPADTSENYDIYEMERVKLTKEFVFHHYKDHAPHPLEACGVMIGASAGKSFSDKMQHRGIEVVLTAEPSPFTAVSDYLRQTLTPAKPRPIGSLICKLIDKGHDALS